PTAPTLPGDILRLVSEESFAHVTDTLQGPGSGTVVFATPIPCTDPYTDIETKQYRDLFDLSVVLHHLALASTIASIAALVPDTNAIVGFLGNNPFPPISFANVAQFTLDTSFMGGDDTFSVDKNFVSPSSLLSFSIASGAGNDVLNIDQASLTLDS